MVLHLSVSHSVHRGGCLADMTPGKHSLGQTPSPRQTPPGQIPPFRLDKPPSGRTATAADGTHPTGMHSCTYAMSFLTL